MAAILPRGKGQEQEDMSCLAFHHSGDAGGFDPRGVRFLRKRVGHDAQCRAKSCWSVTGTVMGGTRVLVHVDDSTIASGNLDEILKPMSLSANLSGGAKEYDSSMRPFSRPQRLVFAMSLYSAEVNNGGHEQFYWNSAGVVWRDALEGFVEIGAKAVPPIILESVKIMGGDPPPHRYERQSLMEKRKPDFEDLDRLFYLVEEKFNLDGMLLEHMRKNSKAFVFNGSIMKSGD